MKLNTKVLALMTALAAGAAVAAPTAVGTDITNTATATFTDPTNPADTDPLNPKGSATSNTVTTKVLPLPSFDISYQSGNDGGGANSPATWGANSATTSTPVQQTVAPGATANTPYVVTNTGNVGLTINITSQNASAANTSYATASTAANPSTVTYTYTYKDAIGETQTVTNAASGVVYVPAGGSVTITQNTTIPASAGSGASYGATPVGSVTGNGITATSNGVASGSTLYESQTVNSSGVPVTTAYPSGSDLQYVVISATSASLTNTPTTTPTTSTVTPPPGSTGTPYDGGTPPTSGSGTPPNGGTSPGTTPVVINGDQQIAYPPADTNTTKDVVQFTNTVSNNTGSADTVTLSPGPLTLVNGQQPTLVAGTTTVTDSNGVTWTYTGPGTWTAGENTVQFLDPTTKTPVNTVTVPANGSANYLTQVTYPDSNPNVGTTTLDKPQAVTVIVTTTSGTNPNVSDTTKDIIYPAAGTFGDTAAQTGTAGAYVEDPSKPYYPGSSLTPVPTAPGGTATFPMSVSNTGQYNDTYTLAGAVAIPTTDGSYVIVPVNYVGTGTTTVSTTAADPSKVYTTQQPGTAPVTVKLPDGTTTVVYAPVYTTSTITAGSTATVNANVAVPSTAQTTTTTPVVSQTATGVNSKIVMNDNNDLLPIQPVGKVFVGKFTASTGATASYVEGTTQVCNTGTPTDTTATSSQIASPANYTCQPTSYQPGIGYSYQIIGKNTYNTTISNFTLSDDLTGKPFDLTQVTGSCTNGGTWSYTNNVAKCTYPSLAALQSATMTVNVIIK